MCRKTRSHLSYEERCQIESLRRVGFRQNRIAEVIGVHASTISRELRRNGSGKGYRCQSAQEKAFKRKQAASTRPRKLKRKIKTRIARLLRSIQASPEQISGRLKRMHGVCVSHQTIYQFIRLDKACGGNLYQNLRHGSKKYNRRKGQKAGGRGLIPNRRDIDERDAIVEKKERFGDFELDTIVGAQHRGAILSIVDRSSKRVYLKRLPQATAECVYSAVVECLRPLSRRKLIKTYTSDNGKEFAKHQEIVSALGGEFFFAKPYHSWERGLNEHTNGLVRQYFPKGTDFTTLTDAEVAEVEYRINHRPRKVLDFRTPIESSQAV